MVAFHNGKRLPGPLRLMVCGDKSQVRGCVWYSVPGQELGVSTSGSAQDTFEGLKVYILTVRHFLAL